MKNFKRKRIFLIYKHGRARVTQLKHLKKGDLFSVKQCGILIVVNDQHIFKVEKVYKNKDGIWEVQYELNKT